MTESARTTLVVELRLDEDSLPMRQDLLKTGKPDDRDLVDDDRQVGSERLDRPDPTGLKGSRHARLSEQIQQPADDLTLDEAEDLCGQVTRAWLGDLAPALILLDADSRRRLQAVLTLTRTAVDFAVQPGVEGERVSALNRLHFEVEAALDGEPRGQPAHLLIADEEEHDSWRREAWDAHFDRLRHLAMLGSLDAAQARRIGASMAQVLVAGGADTLGPALATTLTRAEGWRVERDPADAVREGARSSSRQGDGAGSRDPSPTDGTQPSSRQETATADRDLSPPWRWFAAYVTLAERRLNKREADGRSAKLGLMSRLGVLLRARLA